jgi:hypothetical protein
VSGRPFDWVAEERRSHSVRAEVRRLVRRAWRRPLVILLLAALGAGLVVLKITREPTLHTARVLLRVTEGVLSEHKSPLPRRDLRDYVAHVAFGRQQLQGVINELDLYPRRRAIRGHDWAIANLRDHMELDVYRNYFALDRGYSTAPRSARIAIYYSDQDAELAFRVARRLSALVKEREQALRELVAGASSSSAMRTVDRAKSALQASQSHMSELLVELARAEKAADAGRAAQLRYEMKHLFDRIEADRDLLERTEAVAATLLLQRHLNDADIGLRFEVIDERPPSRTVRQWLDLAAVAVVCFIFLLPLCVIAVGAFDRRVRDRDDIERLGLAVVGHVPAFPGHRDGSMRFRARRDRARRNTK